MSAPQEPSQAFTRTWTTIAAHYTDDKRDQLAALFDGLCWEPYPGTLSFSAGHLVKIFISTLKAPLPLEIAVSHHLAPFGLIGIHIPYKNGRAKAYLLDQGDTALILASDFWPNAEHATLPTPTLPIPSEQYTTLPFKKS